MSFLPILNIIQPAIEADADLETLCQLYFGKSITVKRGFKKREEIDAKQLPMIRITRPLTSGSAESEISGGYIHRLRLYCGFYFTGDTDAAVNLAIEFEEAIERAVMRNNTDSTFGALILPDSSINDEGARAPSFWAVKDFGVNAEMLYQ